MNPKCLICGGRTEAFINTKGFRIYRCLSCGFGMTEQPNIQDNNYHRDDEYIEEEKLFRNIFLRRVKIINSLSKPGRVLEIGCSTGLMLSLLKNSGWETVGVEISPKAAAAARARGLEIIEKDFLKLEVKKKFDLLIFNHTLEHLVSPEKVIRKATKLLKKEGLLYIDLPNFGSLSAKLEKKNWPSLLPDEHLWHFSEKALKLLLLKNGFKIIFTNKSSGIWDYEHPFFGIFLSLISFKKRFFKEILTALPSLLTTGLGIGSDLMMISKYE